MSRIKTLAIAMLVVLLGGLPTAQASDVLSEDFAACMGKLRAQLEFQWLFSDPAADQTAARSLAMEAILETMVRRDNARDLLMIRIEAKHAHTALLHRATFNEDDVDAGWARRRAVEQIAMCTGFLLI